MIHNSNASLLAQQTSKSPNSKIPVCFLKDHLTFDAHGQGALGFGNQIF